MDTKFASPERQSSEDIEALRKRLQSAPLFVPMLEAFPTMAVVLNPNRQIVLHNQRFDEAIPSGDRDRLLGLRVGEAIGCLNVKDAPSGCGTNDPCKMCGAVLTMLEAQAGQPTAKECRVLTGDDDQMLAWDFRILAVPMTVGDDVVTILSLLDISSEKRRSVLERIFFHDVLNTASGLRTVTELFHLVSQAEKDSLLIDLGGISDQLIDEIQTQRDLLAAERDELAVSVLPTVTDDMLEHVLALYRFHTLSRDRHIKTVNRATGMILHTDATLLSRAIGNLMKNALEASGEGEVVSLSCDSEGDHSVVFSVHNHAVIPEQARLQIFQRSFSTKGVGRGVGIYSVKLLVENFLRGRVSFTSDEQGGTTFFVHIPTEFPFSQKKTQDSE
jgi:signal transduction histidine kinase